MRIALGIEYDGTNYRGWQSQRDVVTIQQVLEHALSKIAAHGVSLTCAGRTDAGVHAFGQVVHFDTEVSRSESAWVFGTNSNLPADIRVLWTRSVAEDFHARHGATARHYRYMIYNHRVSSALLRHRAMWWPWQLDVQRMCDAAYYLLGEHDFSSFRGSGCQAKTPIRNVISLTVTRGGNIVNIDIKANAFLMHMVRNIVGVLIKIGSGEREPIWAQEVLAARDRKQAALSTAACGLYLVKVDYP